MSKTINRIVIIQTAFIGDTALALFFAQRLKNNFPSAKIDFITTPAAAEFVSKAKCINRCFVFDKRGEDAKITDIAKKAVLINLGSKIDLLFGLHRSFRSSLLCKHIKAECKIGFKNAAMACIYHKKAKYYPNLHEIERNAELLEYIELKDKNNIPSVEFYENDVSNEILEVLNKGKFIKTIVIAPGSVWNTKKWLPEYFRKTAFDLENQGYKIILTGSKSEYELCKYVGEDCEAINLAGKAKISETITVMKNSDLVICNDSAPTHLALLAGTPNITIYGATSPIFGFYPRGIDSLAVTGAEMDCKPCRIHGSRECPRIDKGLHCMKGIKPEEVVEAALKILNK